MNVLGDRVLDHLRDAASEPLEGDLLDGRFELMGPIGTGGMGTVFAGWDRRGRRRVAVKVARGSDAETSARFEREALTLSRLKHPAIVGYVSHGTLGGSRYLVMERVDGSTLAERLARGPLSVAETATLGLRIAGALGAMHVLSLVHRDVKPSNVVLDRERVAGATLLDFGLTREAEQGSMTAKGALVGTPGYMAPEQVRGEGVLSSAVDVFALGCVLFECLTGRPPFFEETPEALFVQVLLGAPGPLRSVRPDVPPALERTLHAMLDKRVAMRPTAGDLERELGLFAELGEEALTPASPAPRLAMGTVISGKYCIEGPLGEGGMGIVLLAKHAVLGTRVALKFLRPPRNDLDEASFLREAQAAARLESEHVARVLDVGRADDGTPFMVMEHLNGVDLAHELQQKGRLPPAQAVAYVLEACEAIAEAHALGIVHRDIKPSNLFLTSRRDGTPLIKVLDFGISKATWTSEEMDVRGDIWSLGVVLYELVSGVRPEPRPKRLLGSDMPAGLEAVILRCLAHDPQSRYAGVAELIEALAPLAKPRGVRRSRRWVDALLGAALTLVLLVVFAFVKERQTKVPTTNPPAVSVSMGSIVSKAAMREEPEPSSLPAFVAPAASPPVQAMPPKRKGPPRLAASVAPTPSAEPAPQSHDLDLRDPILEKR